MAVRTMWARVRHRFTSRAFLVSVAVCSFALAGLGCAAQQPQPEPAPTMEAVPAEPPESVYFQVQYGDALATIHMRHVAREDKYYVFLPAFAEGEHLYSSSVTGVYLRDIQTLNPAGEAAGYVHYPPQAPLEEIALDRDYALCLSVAQQQTPITVRFMRGENIAAMFINTLSGSLDAVMADQDHKEEASMTLLRADGSVDYDAPMKYIKGRGNTSWTYTPKRSFNIRLEEDADILDMGASDKWRLIANGLDPTLIRNKMAYDLADAVGMPFSVDSRFIDLYIDGNYWGVYLITDRVEIGEHRVEVRDLEAATAAVNLEKLEHYPMVYLGAEDAGQSDFADREAYSDIPNDPEDITGGYLVEFTSYVAKDDTTPMFATDSGKYFFVTSPEHITQRQHAYLSKLFSTVDQRIMRGRADVLEYIDGESWANMVVISELLMNRDAMLTSQFFYKDADGPDGYSPIYAGPLWDMDKTLTNGSCPDSPRTLLLMQLIWFNNLYRIQSFRELMIQQYENRFLPLVEELIDTGIDGYVKEISASAAMDYVLWPREEMSSDYTWREDTLAASANKLKGFFRERVDFLTDLWVNGGDYHTVQIYYQYTDRDYFQVANYYLKDGERIAENMLRRDNRQVGQCYLGTPHQNKGPYDLSTPVTKDLVVTVPVLGYDEPAN